MTEAEKNVVGVVLAGGLGRRMGGGDKFLRPVGGVTLLERVIERARPQVKDLFLNVNGDPARLPPPGLDVRADVVEGFAGPLAGVLTGMAWATERHPDARWLATFAADTPFFPGDLVARLLEPIAAGGAPLACAASDGRTHPVFGLWPVALMDDLRAALEGGERKIDRFTGRHGVVSVAFDAVPFDPFFNVNTADDLARAEAVAGAAP